ncbi:MAG: SDR family oxidoreductase, partial [Chlamydiae bacterium]|nr:SDR family oxidoreductase [Chlamydiota bacterium]
YFRGRKGYAVYSATKAAIVNFTQGLAEELPTLFVNALTPQRISSPLRMKNFPKEPKEDLLTLEEIAEAITNILSQNLNTGAIIDIRKNF